MTSLVTARPEGPYCEAGGFHIDPTAAVARGVLTSAEAGLPFPGGEYYCAAPAAPLLRAWHPDVPTRAVAYGETFRLGDVTVSLHPSGSALGAAQVRIAQGDDVWVYSGSFKRQPDPTCAAFETTPCRTWVTDATFALPIFRWPSPRSVAAEIRDWWATARTRNRPALLYVESPSIAARLVAELDLATGDSIYAQATLEAALQTYRTAGVALGPVERLPERVRRTAIAGALVLAPLGSDGERLRLAHAETALASGWMRLRGTRRWRSVDRGFVFSNAADWPQILETAEHSGASTIRTVGGHAPALARYLRERGRDADVLP